MLLAAPTGYTENQLAAAVKNPTNTRAGLSLILYTEIS